MGAREGAAIVGAAGEGRRMFSPMRDLNDLQFFAAVVGHRSFSAAARLLGVPKSRVSRRVAVLEERLGVRLIERSTRKLNITEMGQQVYEHARTAIEEADAIEDAVLRMR